MQQSNPDAVLVLQQQATQANNDRVAALVAEFGDDKTFLAAAIKDPNMTVEKAKAQQFDALKASSAKLKAENETLKKQNVVGFAPSDKPKAIGAVPANGAEAQEAAALDYWNNNEDIRVEFGGIYTDFLAGFKNCPEDYK